MRWRTHDRLSAKLDYDNDAFDAGWMVSVGRLLARTTVKPDRNEATRSGGCYAWRWAILERKLAASPEQDVGSIAEPISPL